MMVRIYIHIYIYHIQMLYLFPHLLVVYIWIITSWIEIHDIGNNWMFRRIENNQTNKYSFSSQWLKNDHTIKNIKVEQRTNNGIYMHTNIYFMDVCWMWCFCWCWCDKSYTARIMAYMHTNIYLYFLDVC